MRTRAALRSRPFHTGVLASAFVLLAAAGCRTVGVGGAGASASAVPPTLTIERFLSAANQNDLDTMASLFGTRDGSITGVWTREEIDGRMFIFASVLRHSDYAIAGEQIVPGRRDEATQFVVRLELADGARDVPFTLVRTAGSDHWLIESICLERVTRENATC